MPPDLFWNRPKAHSRHATDPVTASNVPGAHFKHTVVPFSSWYRPAGQATQSALLVPASDDTERRPGGHGVQAADGAYPTVALHCPAGQARQAGAMADPRLCRKLYRCSMRDAGHDSHWGPAELPSMHSQMDEFDVYLHVPRPLQRRGGAHRVREMNVICPS